MTPAYNLDACAVIAFLSDEAGADEMENLFNEAERGKSYLYMHNLNLLEIYYGTLRSFGESQAVASLEKIRCLPVTFLSEIGGAVLIEAGRLKVGYRMSLADAILVATASILGAIVVTSDHHELDAIDTKEDIDFYWFR